MAGLFWEPQTERSPAAQRALLAAAALIAGYVIARACPDWPSSAWFSAALACSAMAAAAGNRAKRGSSALRSWRGALASGALIGAVLAVGGGWFALRIHERPADRLHMLLESTEGAGAEMILTVEGTITGAPEVQMPRRDMMNPRAPREPGLRFDLAIDTVHSSAGARRASGVLSVRIAEVPPSPGAVGGPASASMRRGVRCGRRDPGPISTASQATTTSAADQAIQCRTWLCQYRHSLGSRQGGSLGCLARWRAPAGQPVNCPIAA